MRKSTRRKSHVGMHPLDAITANQPFASAEADTILLRVDASFEHLSNGGADPDHFDRLAATLNVGMVRAEEIGGSKEAAQNPGLALFKAAQAALMEADALFGRHGKYGFTGPGLETMRAAVSLYSDILRASSPLQMHRAQMECMKRLRAGHFERTASVQRGDEREMA